ncbi:MAG: RraA family protein [Erythrobacter sp.]|uniref:RraA family protein n=1 Tax=Erythrobacter sp. TaxID=1042 RepID=UPI00262EF6BA|nr:RraA family protein [Erythrobacter sp.]MDJ0978151.1 RraA family protein [Erythrobacter sp.]
MELSDILRRLSGLDACAVSDACDKLGLSPAQSGLAPRTGTARLSGRVMTLRLAEGPPPADAPPVHLGSNAINRAQPGDIIVVEQRSGVDAGCWGGILSNGAKTRGIAGVIADGAVRDVDEAAALDFPIFARATTARTARGRVHEAETGGPVTIGEATVNAGDFVVVDGSGAAFIPADRIADVLVAASEIAAREAELTRAVRSGVPIDQVMGGNYEHMLEDTPS